MEATTDDAPASTGPGDGSPQPFSISHDPCDRSFCDHRVEVALDELDAAGVAVEAPERDDVDDVYVLLRDLAAAAEEASDDDRVDALHAALDDLRVCYEGSCECSTWAWEGTQEFADELLGALGDRRWLVVDCDGTGRDIVSDRLSVTELFERVPIERYGFDSMSLTWDGAKLDASFSGYPWGSHTLVARELTGLRDEVYETWTGIDSEDAETMAHWLCRLSEPSLRLVLDAVEEDSWDFDRFWFTDLVEMAHHLEGDRDAAQVAFAMAEEWAGTTEELAGTARLVAATAA